MFFLWIVVDYFGKLKEKKEKSQAAQGDILYLQKRPLLFSDEVKTGYYI